MTDAEKLEATLHRVSARGLIVSAERNLSKSRYRREPLSPEEIANALELKAYYLAKKLKSEQNPFEGWHHAGADRLAKSYSMGRS